MTEKNITHFRISSLFSGLLLSMSVLIVLGTAITSSFLLETYNSICICTVNLLAYAWISFAVTILLSLITFNVMALTLSRSRERQRHFWINMFSILQALAFIAGIVFLVLFMTRLTDVM